MLYENELTYRSCFTLLLFTIAEKETDYEKQLKEEEKILDSIAEKKGLLYSSWFILHTLFCVSQTDNLIIVLWQIEFTVIAFCSLSSISTYVNDCCYFLFTNSSDGCW